MDYLMHSDIPAGARYYGMVSDAVDRMRGCAPVPGYVASGPTGVKTWGWDFDGSYGDWYGGHELAHTYGRSHANFCGATGGSAYPYANGRISPSLTGNSAIYGFDIGTRAIYEPDWRDVMTYCDNQWLSDFTYEALMTKFQSGPVAAADLRGVDQTDRLLVVGTMDPETHETELEPLVVIPNAGDVEPRLPGDHAIVLRGADGGVLVRYPFTPEEMDGGPAPADERDVALLGISELVPFVAGTMQVEILGPSGLMATVQAGANPPTVTVLAPNGGEMLMGDVTVSWTASDTDGDPLIFNVQYSPDNGTSWDLLAHNLTSATVTLPAADFVAGSQGRVRVWASDGIHTASDQSDGTFVIPNHPPAVTIRQPVDNTVLFIGQSLNLEADAYDGDAGSMDDAQVRWTSSLDGGLGSGAQLTVASLRAGTHLLTVTADDGQGGVATAAVTVTVRADLAEPTIREFFLPLIAQ